MHTQLSIHLTPQEIRKPQRKRLLSSSLRFFSLCGAALLAFVILHSSFVIAAPPPELTILRQQYDKVVAERVTAPFDASLGELNTKYTAGLDRAIAEAKAAGKLEDILAIEAEKKRLTDKLPIPQTDDDKEPESLKRFRGIYRQQLATLTATRDKTHGELLPPYTAKLQALEATLVKNDRVDEAKEVLAYRQGLSVGLVASSAPAVAAPAAATQLISAMPAAELPKTKGDDRKAAEWILANWSDFRLFFDGNKGVSKTESLPKGKFSITSIAIDGRFYTGATPLNQAVMMENLAGLTSVTFCALGSFPDLKDEDLAFLATLTSLEELRLSKLGCTDAFLGHLKGLKKLTSVNFSELSKLTGTGFAQLAALPELRTITHWKGGMTDEGMAAIAKLPSVTSVDLQGSDAITNASIQVFRSMEKLTSIYFSATSITPEGFEGVTLPKITSMGANSLAKLSLGELLPKLAPHFPSMTRYMHSYGANTPEDLAALAHFKKLNHFTLTGSVKDEAWSGLQELRELESFRTYSNEMSPALWQTLEKLKKLKHVQYGSKPPDAAALAAFKKQRPDVKVEP
jgi:hypothetical protein